MELCGMLYMLIGLVGMATLLGTRYPKKAIAKRNYAPQATGGFLPRFGLRVTSFSPPLFLFSFCLSSRPPHLHHLRSAPPPPPDTSWQIDEMGPRQHFLVALFQLRLAHLPVNHPIYSLFPQPLLSCGTSAFTGGMNQKVLDTIIAGSGYRNLASRPRKSCGTWIKRTQHSSAPSPYAACQQIDKVP